MTQLDIDAASETARRLAHTVGGIQRDYFQRPRQSLKHTEKGDPTNIVTEADEAAERAIVTELTRTFPDHHIVGEEGGDMGASALSAAYHWYVDPIDGTTNFAHGIPMFCVSIALTDSNMNPLLGVVYDPIADEEFLAVAGAGATLNGEPMCVSAADTLERSVVATGFSYDKQTNPDNNLAEFNRVMPKVRGIRRMGAAALDMCYVACGRFEAFWEPKLNPWDSLAGALCVLEAGGQVTDHSGRDPRLICIKRVV